MSNNASPKTPRIMTLDELDVMNRNQVLCALHERPFGRRELGQLEHQDPLIMQVMDGWARGHFPSYEAALEHLVVLQHSRADRLELELRRALENWPKPPDLRPVEGER